MDETLEDRAPLGGNHRAERIGRSASGGWLVVAAASLVFVANIVSPPRLMDDVDAVQAQIARNMLASAIGSLLALTASPTLRSRHWSIG